MRPFPFGEDLGCSQLLTLINKLQWTSLSICFFMQLSDYFSRVGILITCFSAYVLICWRFLLLKYKLHKGRNPVRFVSHCFRTISLSAWDRGVRPHKHLWNASGRKVGWAVSSVVPWERELWFILVKLEILPNLHRTGQWQGVICGVLG